MPKYTWEDRAIAATRGNQTRFGCMLLAALGRVPDKPPQFTGSPTTTSDGFMMCNFVNMQGEHHPGALAGEVADLERNIVGFPKHIRMTPDERKEFYAMWHRWMGPDYRSPPGLRLDDG
jgi:hypothetical protein